MKKVLLVFTFAICIAFGSVVVASTLNTNVKAGIELQDDDKKVADATSSNKECDPACEKECCKDKKKCDKKVSSSCCKKK